MKKNVQPSEFTISREDLEFLGAVLEAVYHPMLLIAERGERVLDEIDLFLLSELVERGRATYPAGVRGVGGVRQCPSGARRVSGRTVSLVSRVASVRSQKHSKYFWLLTFLTFDF